jgi:hypothetical protein
MLALLLLATIGGILLGYALHEPLRLMSWKLQGYCYRFWHYTILKEPEPDFSEIMARTIPSLLNSMVAIKVISDMSKEIEKEIVNAYKKR